MPGTVEITTTDTGRARLERELKKLKRRPAAKIGVLSANRPIDADGDITMAGLAAVHEFGARINHPGGTPFKVVGGRAVFLKKGTPGATGVTGPHLIVIPQRSFMRKTMIVKRFKYQVLAKQLLGQIAAGEMTTEKALSLIGFTIEGDMKLTIAKGVKPPLKPATIRRRKVRSTKPLIDSGRLRQSISHVVQLSKGLKR